MRVSLLVGTLVLVFGIVGSACLAPKGPCQSNDDCLADQICLNGLCGLQVPCGAGKVCNPSGGKDLEPRVVSPGQESTCTAGERRCEGNTLKICQPDGKTWSSLDCGVYHECQAGVCARKPRSPLCGNGKKDDGEQCDDGNLVSGDGCSSYCLNEKVVRWEVPQTEKLANTFVLGSWRCRDAETRKKSDTNPNTLYIKISPVICRVDGRPIASLDTVRTHVGYLNKVFGVARIVFVMGNVRWEDDAGHCEVFYNTESTATLQRYTLADSISVFYARNISGGNFSIGGFANLSGVVLNATAFKVEDILAHELGHSFGLDHPHACRHGKETKATCSTHGDQLCDTPVDPGPKGVNGLDVCPDGSTKNGACVVTGCQTVNCPGGEKPLIHNLMSYYHCGAALTPDQIATVRCLAFHEQSGRASLKRPCSADAECGTSKCKDGFCESSSTDPGCTKDEDCGSLLRCDSGQCVSCVQNRDPSVRDSLCCSKERDGKGRCCEGKECCGAQNNSAFTEDGKCRCKSGFTWTEAVATNDFRCKSTGAASCQLDGMWSANDAACCSKERDALGKCCTGKGCCATRNHSYFGSDGRCQCQTGYEWVTPGDTTDRRCKAIPAPVCKKDGEAAASDAACCSKERDDQGKCCTGDACCGPQNNSQTAAGGTCTCATGFEWVTPGSTTDRRCKRPVAPTCQKGGESAGQDSDCCSKERNDQGLCCTGKECCGPQNNSQTAANGTCQCKPGYTWMSPNAQNDWRCQKVQPPPCKKDGEASTQASDCCSKERDDAGVCCTGNGCCTAAHFAKVDANGACTCLAGYERVSPGDPKDVRCKQKAQTGLSCSLTFTMTGHSNLIPTVDVSEDGKMIASASYDRTARLWDAKTGKLLRTLSGSRNAVMTVQFRPGNQEVATGDYSNTFRRWNVSTGAYLTGLQLFAPIRAVAYDLTGQKIVTGSEKGATLWDLNGGGYAFTTTAFVRDLALRPDGKHIALARKNKTVDIYDMNTRQKVRTLSAHGADVFAVGYSSDGAMLASASGKLHLWKTSDGSLVRTIAAHTGAVYDVTFHPTKPYVLTAGYDNSIKVWDVKTGALVQTLAGHTGPVYTISMSADGSVLASGSKDNTVRVWSCR